MKLLDPLIVFSLLFALQKVLCAGSDGSPLPKASAKPINVDPKLDCAIKELAWDFANQLLTEQVDILDLRIKVYLTFVY